MIEGCECHATLTKEMEEHEKFKTQNKKTHSKTTKTIPLYPKFRMTTIPTGNILLLERRKGKKRENTGERKKGRKVGVQYKERNEIR